MGTVLMLSFVATGLSVLAFCLVRRPVFWLKLWCPQREYLAWESPTEPERKFLLGVRVRATLAGMILLMIAILLPVVAVTSLRLNHRPSDSGWWTETSSSDSAREPSSPATAGEDY
ncbi:MAG: hypothetical protein JXA11_08740 [Phycisphaerae bacterium]|nr:hypothetical protein [Phycisphaerae bacterium]